MSAGYNSPMMRSGSGIFYDGITSARHIVGVELGAAALLVRAAEGHLLARWPYGDLEHLSAHDGVLRLGRAGSAVLARLEVHDPELAAAIDEQAATVDRTGTIERRGRTKVIAWSVAAVVSLVLMGIFGVPAIADRLTPYVPVAVERKFGEAADAQVRAMLDTDNKGAAFECGHGEAEKEGRAALGRLVSRLEAAAEPGLPIVFSVLRKPEANAFALPGGHIYLFEGLIRKAETPDELAGVIAHEFGHVVNRDSTRSVMQAAALSFLFGMVLGDFVGGGAVVLASKTLLQTSYSREVERRADAFAVELMDKVGGNPRSLGAILVRIEGSNHPGSKLLIDHPDTKDRLAAINMAAPGGPLPLISASEWAAIKRVCSGS
jgi:Zn-dependent protease with chaperone function